MGTRTPDLYRVIYEKRRRVKTFLGTLIRAPLHCVCAVFRHRTGVPICFTGLSRVCVWQAVRGEGVVGPHAATSSGYRHCVGVCRVAVVARLQEI